MKIPKYLFPLALLVTFPFCGSGQTPWSDITSEAQLGKKSISRLKFTDLNEDGYPDIVMLSDKKEASSPMVYLQDPPRPGQSVPVFSLKEDSGLPTFTRGDVLVFSDLDNDGHQDAIIGRYLDIYQDDYTVPDSPVNRNGWMRGHGDGSFSDPVLIEGSQPATARAIAVGDVNEDGLPDLFIGNWYERYFSGYEAFPNDLLLQYRDEEGSPAFTRWAMPDETRISDHLDDLGGRPTYGVALPRLDDGLPMLLELNYGRRWNRLYKMQKRIPMHAAFDPEPVPELVLKDPRARAFDVVRQLKGENIAAETHVDGDAIRHGRHPRWPKSNADAQPRSLRPDEYPFRANGNTFDTAVGDIDNDGDFDLFVSTIIHAWAGESSDRSRFLVNQLKETDKLNFLSFERLSVDRIPDLPVPGSTLDPVLTNYNQGDIYAELADLNNDGRLDLVLCSSDYPDPPPHDERLRIYFQQNDGRFLNVTEALGIDHVGAGMVSLADVDRDGDLDLIVGQSFNRLPREQRRAAALISGALDPDDPEDTPPRTRARLFRNESPNHSQSLLIDLSGNPESGSTRDAFGTVVRVTADLDGDDTTPDVVQMRQVLGPAGHSGKQSMFTLHFGLGKASKAKRVEIIWPGKTEPSPVLEGVAPGHYSLNQADGILVPQ